MTARGPAARGGAERRQALRLDADPEDVGRGLGQLVVAVLELLRELLERQAIRRMDGGDLSDDQVEDLGRSLIEVRRSIERLRTSLALSDQDADEAVSLARDVLGAPAPPGARSFASPAAGDRADRAARAEPAETAAATTSTTTETSGVAETSHQRPSAAPEDVVSLKARCSR
ncbi:Gas vesicle protein K [Frankia canadensis]|uniref:Gas vesicle protein K n=1 Tax=Frankia canadensis TaxID=1836972 RepID=A0A2I2KN89_9ACTN|nr:gas vesicle protein K [Frankia canadensis]SNQ47134.1 Gas vesicle protein K [Frankia canadensis]SOU54424.1 Gas vesicle protein K [Frankia canadensis]